MSNESKSRTLGMPHGTATHRLRKNILFHQLKKHGENVCAKCQSFIESVDELSIEHLKPWEGVSSELFWDLENIAYSHLHCNRPHKYVGSARRFSPPEGQHRCGSCDSFKPETDFTVGSKGQCRDCKSKLNASRDRNFRARLV